MVAFVLTRTAGTVLILTIGIKAFCITFVSAKQVSQDQTVKWTSVKSVMSMPNASTILACASRGIMEMDLPVIKYPILVIQIHAKMEQSARNWRVASTTVSACQEPPANTVKSKMLVSRILVRTMGNAFKLLMMDITAFVKMDTPASTANQKLTDALVILV